MAHGKVSRRESGHSPPLAAAFGRRPSVSATGRLSPARMLPASLSGRNKMWQNDELDTPPRRMIL